MTGQQIVISGIGGQGVLFLTRLLAEAALELHLPLLSSETHGMAQRGGTVVSHLKVGPFHSPLVRSGAADVLLVLKSQNLLLHRHFATENGLIVTNSENSSDPGAIDATKMAEALGSTLAANVVLLGFALSFDRLFCDARVIRRVLHRLLSGDRLDLSLRALEMGLECGKK